VLALLATRDFVSWSVEPSCSSFAKPQSMISQRWVDPFQGDACMPPVAYFLLFCALYVCATCQPRGPHLMDVTHVRTSPRHSTLHDFCSRKEILSTLNPRYAIPRGGSDPTVLLWLGSNGLDLLPCSSQLGTSRNQEFGFPSKLTNPEFAIS
jgi:hypothetical protein